MPQNKFASVVIYVLTISIPTTVLAQIDPVLQKAIEDVVQEEFFTKGRTSALGLAIVRDGKVFYTNGYGFQNIENSVPADSSTLFYIGSISKSFTATVAVKLLSEKFPELGEKVLDTPIRKLVPSFNFTLSDRYRTEQSTFRDLLAHRVGEYVQGINLGFATTPDIKDLIYRQRYSSEQFPFRNAFVYNNGHFSTVGELLAEIAGVPFLQLLEEFFEDLEMTNSTYSKQSDDPTQMPNRALGYYWKDGKLNRFNTELQKIVLPMIAAGGIVSNANDMAKYALFHLNQGRVGNKQVISEEVMKWLYKNSNPFLAPTTGWKTEPGQKEHLILGYGLAFLLSSYDGWQEYEHNGHLPPFFSHLGFIPGQNISIFLTTSSTGIHEGYIPSHAFVYRTIADILTGGESTESKPKTSSLVFDDILKPSLKSLEHGFSKNGFKNKINCVLQDDEILGHYGNGLLGELDIVEKINATGNPQPYMTLGKWATGFLTKISDGEYKVEIDSDYGHNYYSQGYYESPYFVVSYDGVKTLTVLELDAVYTFEKDQLVEDLPVVPWSLDSCGPLGL